MTHTVTSGTFFTSTINTHTNAKQPKVYYKYKKDFCQCASEAYNTRMTMMILLNSQGHTNPEVNSYTAFRTQTHKICHEYEIFYQSLLIFLLFFKFSTGTAEFAILICSLILYYRSYTILFYVSNKRSF